MDSDISIRSRQTRLSPTVLVAWAMIAGSYVAHQVMPAWVPEILPIILLFASRIFLWPAFPRMSRVAWPVFWCAQVLMIFLVFTRSALASHLSTVWALITVGMFLFLFVSDAVLVWRGRKRAHGE